MSTEEMESSGDGRYRLLVDAITDYAIYMLDPNGLVSSWNSGARRFKGYEEHEILGEHFSRFYTQEDREAGIPAIALRKAEHEGRFEAEGWRVRKDGSRFWAFVMIDPIRDSKGRLIGFAKVTRDLTERRAAEEALRRSEQQFRLLVHGVIDYAIYMLDPQGNVASWNAGAQRIKGYGADEILGRHFSTFYTPADQAHGLPRTALETATREGRFESEGWRVRKDGTLFRAHVVIDALRTEDGRLRGFAKVTRDISERVKAQKALDEAREALFQSQKLEAIGQLTGGIAHDFNNLLAAVLGGLELLRKRLPDDPRALALLDNVVLAARRGAGLTQRMLAFARRQDLAVQSVDVASLVNGILDLLTRSIGPTLRLSISLPPGLPPARTDLHHLETALLNLVVNARDAMPDGGEVRLEADTAEPGDAEAIGLPADIFLRLRVVDTGTGMPPDVAARAVEPFFTTKGTGKGTGLGLSMVHGLAEQSGGRLVIQSRAGEGTSVELWLPRSTDPAEAVIEAPAPEIDTSSRRSLRILVVDDDELVLTNTLAMLDDMGHDAIGVSSASEALAELRETSGAVDVLLADQAMPDRTGLELAEDVAELWPHIGIVIASGYSEILAESQTRHQKLPKPYSMAELSALLDRLSIEPNTAGLSSEVQGDAKVAASPLARGRRFG